MTQPSSVSRRELVRQAQAPLLAGPSPSTLPVPPCTLLLILSRAASPLQARLWEQEEPKSGFFPNAVTKVQVSVFQYNPCPHQSPHSEEGRGA